MKTKIYSLILFIVILIVFTGNLSFASSSDVSINQDIDNIINHIDGYYVVDKNDVDVTNRFLDKFHLKYDINDILQYLSQQEYSIKIVNENNEYKLMSDIINRSYGAKYKKTLSKSYNGDTLYLIVEFQLFGQLEFDNSTGIIITVYNPSLLMLGFDKPANVKNAEASPGLLSNGNKTINHRIVIDSKMKVQVYGDIFEWVDMPTIIQNYSYTPSAF